MYIYNVYNFSSLESKKIFLNLYFYLIKEKFIQNHKINITFCNQYYF